MKPLTFEQIKELARRPIMINMIGKHTSANYGPSYNYSPSESKLLTGSSPSFTNNERMSNG